MALYGPAPEPDSLPEEVSAHVDRREWLWARATGSIVFVFGSRLGLTFLDRD